MVQVSPTYHRESHAHLCLAQVVHAPRHVGSEVKQLLGGESGGGAVGDGERRVRLQNSALPQEVQQVAVRSKLNGQVQIACGNARGCLS